MKKFLFIIALIPTFSFASVYNCSGQGFFVDIAGAPLQMKIAGNGFDSMAKNIHVTATFDTVISGNTISPVATLKLTIKDSSFGSPGDNFKAQLQVSSAAGIKDFTELNCIRGND